MLVLAALMLYQSEYARTVLGASEFSQFSVNVQSQEMGDFLSNESFWKENGIVIPTEGTRLSAKKLTINLVKNIDDPFYVQKDEQGNLVIASNATVNKNTINVNVALGEYVINDHTNYERWIIPEVMKIIDLITPEHEENKMSENQDFRQILKVNRI